MIDRVLKLFGKKEPTSVPVIRYMFNGYGSVTANPGSRIPAIGEHIEIGVSSLHHRFYVVTGVSTVVAEVDCRYLDYVSDITLGDITVYLEPVENG